MWSSNPKLLAKNSLHAGTDILAPVENFLLHGMIGYKMMYRSEQFIVNNHFLASFGRAS